MGTDAYQGFMLGGHVTAAHVSDSVGLEPLVEELNLPAGALVLADKGYAGERNEAVLEARGLKNGIMEKAWRNRPSRSGPRRATCSSAGFGMWWSKGLGRSSVAMALAGRDTWGG